MRTFSSSAPQWPEPCTAAKPIPQLGDTAGFADQDQYYEYAEEDLLVFLEPPLIDVAAKQRATELTHRNWHEQNKSRTKVAAYHAAEPADDDHEQHLKRAGQLPCTR